MEKKRKKAVAFIPARGGSKRFPGKNIVEFRGAPIISYTISAAIKTGLFDRVVCSSDDQDILDCAASFGADVVRRASEFAEDHVATAPVCLNFLEQEEQAGHTYDILCCLYATAPLRTAQDITSTMDLVLSGETDFAMAVTRADFSPHHCLRENKEGSLEPVWPEYFDRQSQDLDPLVVNNASTYIVRVESFRRFQTLYGPNLKGYRMPRIRSADIDEEEDLQIALAYAGYLKN